MFVLGSSDMYALLLLGNVYGSLDNSKTSDRDDSGQRAGMNTRSG